MLKKRTSAEASNDEPGNMELGLVSQQMDGVKRSKRSLLSNTTMDDLPMKLLECVLAKAVAMEVEGMKLSKSVWKEKADLVIRRLQNVSSHWNSVLTMSKFRNEVHRVLDGTAQRKIRLEILHQCSIQLDVIKVVTTKDELFMLCRQQNNQDYLINVFDRNNMANPLKDVIPLPDICPWGMAACSLSNCVYLLHMQWDEEEHVMWQRLLVLRIAREDETNQFNTWTFTELRPSFADISVSADGNLVILSKEDAPSNSEISVYAMNGSKQRGITLSPKIHNFCYVFSAIQKSNGNILVVSANSLCETKVLEIDANERIVCQYQSSLLSGLSVGLFADTYGRIFITDWRNRMELLDSELNLLQFTGPRLIQEQVLFVYEMHYDRERNEIVRIDDTDNPAVTALTIFRFKEE